MIFLTILFGRGRREKEEAEPVETSSFSPSLVAPSRSGKFSWTRPLQRVKRLKERVSLSIAVLARPALTMGCPPGQMERLPLPLSQAGVPIAFVVVVLESRVLGSVATSSSTVHKNPLNRVPPSCSAKRREGSCRFAVPLAPPRGGVRGNGALCSSLARRWSQAQLPLFEEEERKRERIPFSFPFLVPSSSLLRPRHASPFRRPRSRDYRQRDRSLLAC